MSLQSNLKNVKESFDRDEKILESAFALEILWKRYRKYFIAIFALAVCALLGWYVSGYIESKRADEATSAYAKILINSSDEEALATLKNKSPELYDMYRFFNADNDIETYKELAISNNSFVRSLAAYEVASLQATAFVESHTASSGEISSNVDSEALKNRVAMLEHTSLRGLRNLALLQEAYLLFTFNKADEAHQKLMLIPENSLFWAEAVSLKHLGVSSKRE